MLREKGLPFRLGRERRLGADFQGRQRSRGARSAQRRREISVFRYSVMRAFIHSLLLWKSATAFPG